MEYPQQIQKLKDDNAALKLQLREAKANININAKSMHHITKSDESLELTKRAINLFAAKPNQFNTDINTVSYDTAGKEKKRISEFISQVLLKENVLFDNQLRYSTINAVVQIMRQDIFTPYKFIKTMDIHGHSLSLKAIGVIREMHGLDKYSRDCIFASASQITRAARVVEQYGEHLVPYKLGNVSPALGGGESLEFSMPEALKMIVKACGLEDAAKVSRVCISGSCDGLHVWKGYHLIIMGVKNNGDIGHTPFGKRPNIQVLNDKVSSNVQSPENQFALKIVVASETTALMKEEFKGLIMKLKEETALKDTDESLLLGTGYHPMKMVFNADMAGKNSFFV